ncbi:hypothetical protein A3A95_03220 [Candidatus Nomurabacteria bacterium RIFCSPLOWO2_01_FULL_39_18]|uniref:Uncharacterized protein n=1 Tax=Candidatus Nomurabacteria bacterium RIFCSPHIGHO2_01_FULL_40_24b TaxID=1801739 RepID=A0A1F6V964_9BACT|nr:MAG: hypothetical protein A2647_00025 [Candidatus Nomurabacteria bacterium RIFCSPHIGHO2_01_FULL_40_24b]OGI90890.1 MAG: hypothetical protein A3A95_03220 [Candidatus Nomurabacteria bacterium RIFCSPLOWO2_01_FULL_39_18]
MDNSQLNFECVIKILETCERDGVSTRNFLVKKYPCSKIFITHENKKLFPFEAGDGETPTYVPM